MIINVPADYATLELALVAASDNDTIMLANGTYVVENAPGGTRAISKPVTIIGESRDGVILNPLNDTAVAGSDRGAFRVDAGKRLTLKNLTFDGLKGTRAVVGAVYCLGVGNFENVHFKNTRYAAYNGLGIYYRDATASGRVVDCEFTNLERLGVNVQVGCRVSISRCKFHGLGAGDFLSYGVESGSGATVYISDCDFDNMNGIAVSDGSRSAAILVESYFVGTSNKTIAEGNRIVNCMDGFWVGLAANDSSLLIARRNNVQVTDPLTGYSVKNFGDGSRNKVIVDRNYWGSALGPKHVTYNPNGDGGIAEGVMTVVPFLQEAAVVRYIMGALDEESKRHGDYDAVGAALLDNESALSVLLSHYDDPRAHRGEEVFYVPATAGNWAGTAPDNLKSAVDRIAQAVKNAHGVIA